MNNLFYGFEFIRAYIDDLLMELIRLIQEGKLIELRNNQ